MRQGWWLPSPWTQHVLRDLPWGCSLRRLWLAQRPESHAKCVFGKQYLPFPVSSPSYSDLSCSMSSSCSFFNVLFLQVNLFFLLNTSYSSLPPARSTDLSSGISPFLSLLLGWPFLRSTLIVSYFPQHLLGQLGLEGAGTCPGVKPVLCLPPPKPLPLLWGAAQLGCTAQAVLHQENKEQSLQRPVLPVAD